MSADIGKAYNGLNT